MHRRDIPTKYNNNIPKNYYLTPPEIDAIVMHFTKNQLNGYWMLCWEMLDKNVAFVSSGSVYNIIKLYNTCL